MQIGVRDVGSIPWSERSLEKEMVVRGTWVLPSSEACKLGNFGGVIMAAKYRFALQKVLSTLKEKRFCEGMYTMEWDSWGLD